MDTGASGRVVSRRPRGQHGNIVEIEWRRVAATWASGGTALTPRTLQPEACFDLQIHLDRLNRASQRCRDGLYDLSSGRLTTEAYAQLLEEQRVAQTNWERKHRQYLPRNPPAAETNC